ncbi:hypothetical protein [Pedobacter sp. NJ-S-72]
MKVEIRKLQENKTGTFPDFKIVLIFRPEEKYITPLIIDNFFIEMMTSRDPFLI